MPEALLRATGLTRKSTRDGRMLLDAVDLEVLPGECLAIVGPSGSGKTVLLRALAWLDPLDAGGIKLAGKSPQQCGVPQYRRQVMYLHQRAWLPEGSVRRAFFQPQELAVYVHDEAATANRERLTGWLATLGRSDSFLDQATADLSGGERQIVALLRAMQLAPRILLLDEPMSALDAELQRRCEQLFSDWRDEDRSRAVVLVTHDRQQAQRLADRVLRLKAGRWEQS